MNIGLGKCCQHRNAIWNGSSNVRLKCRVGSVGKDSASERQRCLGGKADDGNLFKSGQQWILQNPEQCLCG